MFWHLACHSSHCSLLPPKQNGIAWFWKVRDLPWWGTIFVVLTSHESWLVCVSTAAKISHVFIQNTRSVLWSWYLTSLVFILWSEGVDFSIFCNSLFFVSDFEVLSTSVRCWAPWSFSDYQLEVCSTIQDCDSWGQLCWKGKEVLSC